MPDAEDRNDAEAPATASEAHPRPDDSEAGSYAELQGEVDRHFAGSWENFLKAVRNPAEILYFVLWRQCGGKADKLRSWATDKKLPADWVPRFFGMLDPQGQFRDGVATRAPEEPEIVLQAPIKGENDDGPPS